jgi:hypothetical protein
MVQPLTSTLFVRTVERSVLERQSDRMEVLRLLLLPPRPRELPSDGQGVLTVSQTVGSVYPKRAFVS